MKNSAPMPKQRWDAFAEWELRSLDEFFRNCIGDLRVSDPNIRDMREEVAIALAGRRKRKPKNS